MSGLPIYLRSHCVLQWTHEPSDFGSNRFEMSNVQV